VPPASVGAGLASGLSRASLDSHTIARATACQLIDRIDRRRMVSLSRWRRAQAYERSYWEGVANRIASGAESQLDWYKWRADQLTRKLRSLGLAMCVSPEAAVVEVGSGPIGLLSFLHTAKRVAVDPLEPFYARNRVLKPAGILYLTVNCRTAWGFVVHGMLSHLRLDPGHPYTFTPRRTRAFLETGNFRVMSQEVESYADAWRADLRSGDTKAWLKARLGVSEFLCSVICERTPSVASLQQ
jgi:hypothetical protein